MGKIYSELKKRGKMLCHITELKNIESILQNGLLSLREVNRRGINVSYLSKKESRDIDSNRGRDRYVRLAYTPYYDMIPANIFREKQANPDTFSMQLAIICVHPDILMEKEGIMFSDKNAVANDVTIYYSENEVYPYIDFEKTYQIRKASNAGQDKEDYKNARQAEVMIPRCVELKYIRKIVVDESVDVSSLLRYGIEIEKCPLNRCYNL